MNYVFYFVQILKKKNVSEPKIILIMTTRNMKSIHGWIVSIPENSKRKLVDRTKADGPFAKKNWKKM